MVRPKLHSFLKVSFVWSSTIATAVSLVACSPSANHSSSSQISIKIPKSNSLRAANSTAHLRATDWDNGCYLVNVTAADIPNASNSSCAVPVGILAGSAAAGGSLTISVPQGTNRKLEVFLYRRKGSGNNAKVSLGPSPSPTPDSSVAGDCPVFNGSLDSVDPTSLVRVGQVASFNADAATVAVDVTLASPADSDTLISQYGLPPACDLSQPSPAVSTLSASMSTITSGTASTVKLIAKNARGIPFTTGGLSVGFTNGGGTSTGTFSSVIDNNDGTYQADFTGVGSGTPTTIMATIGGVKVTSPFPTITVSPSAASRLTSYVSVSGSTVASGASVTVTLHAKDSSGNALTMGGLSVSFSTTGGSSTGTFGSTTDLGNGTYTALFTGSMAGTTVQVTGAIGGQNVYTTPANLQVLPGAASLSASTLQLSPSMITSGTHQTVMLITRDTAGNLLTTGGLSVSFAPVNTGVAYSSATISTATDNGNGTYSAQVTGVGVGTTNSLKATINSSTITSALPNFSVVAGAVSAATSTLTVSNNTLVIGGTSTVTLVTKDAAGNSLIAGGLFVSFSTSGGTTLGSFGSTTDLGNGTYTAVFTGVSGGSATTINAMVSSMPLTSVLPTIAVMPLPVLTNVSNRLISSNTQLSTGQSYSFDFNNQNTGNDDGMTYTCYYDRILDGNVSGMTTCSVISGLTVNASSGVITWNNVPASAAGPYEFLIKGCSIAGCGTEILQIDVKQPYLTANLLADLDAQFAAGRNSEGLNSVMTTSWANLGSTLVDSVLATSLTNLNPWSGDGTTNGSGMSSSAGPFRLVFNGSTNLVDLSAPVGTSMTDFAISTWVRPSNISNPSTILSNGGGAGGGSPGFELVQSSYLPGAVEVAVASHQSWDSVQPSGVLFHYKLNETTLTSGSTIADSSGNLHPATLHFPSGSSWVSVSSAMVGETSDRALQSLTTASTGSYIVSNAAVSMSTLMQFSYEAWFKVASGYNHGGYIMAFGSSSTSDSTDSTHDRQLRMTAAGNLEFQIYNGSGVVSTATSGSYNDGNWHHVVSSLDSSSGGTMKIYVDGALAASKSNTGSAQTGYSGFLKIGSGTTYSGDASGSYNNLIGSIDEVSVYSRALGANEVAARAGAIPCRSTALLADNIFTNVSLTYSSATRKASLYMNGVLQCSATYPVGTDVTNALPLTMAARPTSPNNFGNFWEGAIANVRVYNSSTVDTVSVYNATKGIFP